jgi:flagellar motor switch protein FliM
LASCELRPLGVQGALQLDLKVAFPIIDLLLGGEGKGIAATREITEIEQQIVESVAGIVCRELGAAWQAIHLEVELEQRIAVAEAQRLMPANEKVLSLSFEVALLEVRGGLNLAVPVTLSHALLRQIAGESRETRPRGPAEWQARLQRRLLECPFPVDLGANGLSATYGELSHLEVGALLPLRRSAAQPASLIVGGVEMFAALPARSGETRVAQLLARPQGSQGEDETRGNPEGQKP